MGSPFVMGLNGLVLRNVAGYVKRLKFVGECKEYDSEECYRKGRVPDSTMMLNTLVTVAIERCTALRELWYIALSSLYDVERKLTRPQLGIEHEDAAECVAGVGTVPSQESRDQISFIPESETCCNCSTAT